jgi:fucose 4-O-acetylase-like acetyltransferase
MSTTLPVSGSLTIPRRADLDAVRAFAMLLGIALHAGLSFATIPWIVQDSRQNEWFNLFFEAIHGFRMPLFFLVSGFFTAMIWRR